MSAYNNNSGSIVIPENSMLFSLNSNRGKITVGNECKVSECHNNTGIIRFKRDACIGKIINNSGQISIDNYSKIDLIAGNSGNITLASDCVLTNTKDNIGSITGVKPNFKSGDSQFSRTITYNFGHDPRNIVSSTTIITNDGGSSPSNDETMTTIFENMGTVVSVGGIVTINNSQGSNWTSTTSDGYREKHLISTATVLEDSTAPVVKGANENLCAVCMDRPKNVVFQCGHTCCLNCSDQLVTCHICRVKIDQKIKLFL